MVGTGANTLGLVEEARKERNAREKTSPPFDQVWVVFDRDSFPAADFDNAIHKAESAGMRCAWSNEAFELWYILHFGYRDTAMSRREYQAKLSELLGEPYRKNAPGMYQKLKPHMAAANSSAKRLHRRASGTPPSQANPCTTVYKLVAQLERFRIPSP